MDLLDLDTAIGLTAPLPYALVTSMDGDGRSNALGVSWLSRVSFSPFLMMVSIGKNRYSHKGIAETREFVACFPAADQEKGALYCGTHSGKDGNKLTRSGLTVVPSVKVRPPTIKDCTVALECKVVCAYDAGDHTLFIGEVVAVTGSPAKPQHLFMTTGSKMVAMDNKGNG
jgi:flavin reductase (DIM6/NTAB) family NADH-FMN oxidoreductase RutF